jgi:(2Fe-2S) ferredoxin/SAM-dependent methyltransferase
MQPFRYHVIVCTQPKAENVTCCAVGGRAVVGALYTELGKQGVADDVLVSTTGCLGACEKGPVMVVYPDAVWYGGLKACDVPEIVASHLKAGKVVERLALKDMSEVRGEILEHRKQFAAMMAARDKGGVVPDDLNETLRGFMASRALITALELNVFTAVGAGATASQVVAKLGTDLRATGELLNAMVALGLLQKNGDRYSNTPTSLRFLGEGSPDSARLAMLHNVTLWNQWSNLTERVLRGTAADTRAMGAWAEDARLRPAFVAYMDRNAKVAAAGLVRSLGNGFQRMLDLGGGSAAGSIALAKANPGLQVEVLEQPSMMALTEDYVRQAGVADRVRVRCGDLLNDSFGQGYDLILLSSVAHMFSPEQNRDLLRRACQALAPKGRLVIQDFVLEADGTSPRMGALASLTMLCLSKNGATYTEQEYQTWLNEAGFSEVKRVRLPGPVNLVVGTK